MSKFLMVALRWLALYCWVVLAGCSSQLPVSQAGGNGEATNKFVANNPDDSVVISNSQPLLSSEPLLTLVPVPAQQASMPKTAWMPMEPMPDEYDWIKLISGEWLKGELVSMYSRELEFDSDKLGDLTLDWDDVAEVRTHNVMSMRYGDGGIVEGRLFIQGDEIALVGAGPRIYRRSELISIAHGSENRADIWSVKISFGMNRRSGNTTQEDISTAIDVKRRTSVNRFSFRYFGNFSSTDNKQTESNQRINTNLDWFYSKEIFFRPISFEVLRDPFLNIDYRATYSIGGGYYFIDTSKTSWDFNAGIGYQQTQFIEVENNGSKKEGSPVVELGTLYDTELTRKLDYIFKYNLQIVNEESGNFIQHVETGFEFEMIKDFEIDILLLWDRTDLPTADADGVIPERDDLQMLFNVGYEF